MLYLGRDYPDGFDVFRNRLQKAFRKNSNERDPKKVAQLITQAEFVIKEIEALYMLRKYRSLKRRYYDWDYVNCCLDVYIISYRVPSAQYISQACVSSLDLA